jgi:hypothetical protein
MKSSPPVVEYRQNGISGIFLQVLGLSKKDSAKSKRTSGHHAPKTLVSNNISERAMAFKCEKYEFKYFQRQGTFILTSKEAAIQPLILHFKAPVKEKGFDEMSFLTS